MLSILFYNFIGLVLFPFIFPYLLVKTISHPKQWKQRWGLIPYLKKKKLIWLHGASVGEIKALSSFYQEIRYYFPGYYFLISSYTETGFNQAEKLFNQENCYQTYFPLDFLLSVIIAVLRTKPDLVFFTETEIWPNFLTVSKILKLKVILIGARISDKTYPRYKAFRRMLKPYLGAYKLILAKDELNRKRWIDIGMNYENILVGGSIKVSSSEVKIPQVALSPRSKILIAGPLRKGEFKPILNIYMQLKKKHPNLGLLAAPRYLEMTDDMIKLLKLHSFRYKLRSNISVLTSQVTVLDTIGELAGFYKFADIAFIGGSLVDCGGHNPLEAAFQGVPLVMGPSYQNVQDVINVLDKSGGVKIADSSEQMIKYLDQWLAHPRKTKIISQKLKQTACQFEKSSKRYIQVLRSEGIISH